ncbi:MAG: glucose-1-phosphate adenylyltransferase [Acidimicrobiaceae bacterium]|nr:glucose-1-phosphate adenylyltransferase [Acidimicrobiaceae bacterium]MXW60874.1 glucose-1-phosphate adenylyltransferase [Acidimicrobiaceae bacterium]MXW75074.1 glucose-1-phosphate adenylyltransferase [Acidimicrobiaceae bacterium]MYA74200.1 glucose-1-phosphate adenylyltransferase [Acidimicrobiaceae bacterium]MYC42493.1 glucose-1-phosphate adenylyltransferase [Acidimicrobiaceae bacterium]
MYQQDRRPKVLSVILAGGEGKRLAPLTLDRAKPAVPFGGHYRLIDFPLSNLANGGYRKIVVLTQYKSHSLDVHLSLTWRLSAVLGNYVTSVPAQMRQGPRWFLGSADALFQNLNLVDDEKPDYVFVFGADHIYRIDPVQMLEHHIDSGAGVTVAGIRVPRDQSEQFGVIKRGNASTITAFLEKPEIDQVQGLEDDPDSILASMGNYVFTADTLVELLHENAKAETTGHDVGGDLIPMMVAKGEASVYDFTQNRVPGQIGRPHYWRDVGTIDSYYEAHMDLVGHDPAFDLYNSDWPIYTLGRTLPPAKIDDHGDHGPSDVRRSIISNGAIVAGACVCDSVLSPDVAIAAGAVVESSVLLDGVQIGEGAQVRGVVLDKNVVVPPGVKLGHDLEQDREHYTVSEGGVVVLAKGQTVVV